MWYHMKLTVDTVVDKVAGVAYFGPVHSDRWVAGQTVHWDQGTLVQAGGNPRPLQWQAAVVVVVAGS